MPATGIPLSNPTGTVGIRISSGTETLRTLSDQLVSEPQNVTVTGRIGGELYYVLCARVVVSYTPTRGAALVGIILQSPFPLLSVNVQRCCNIVGCPRDACGGYRALLR